MTSTLNRLLLLNGQPNTGAIEAAETLLEECRDGTVVGFAAIAMLKDDTYSLRQTAVLSRLQLMGALFEMACNTAADT